ARLAAWKTTGDSPPKCASSQNHTWRPSGRKKFPSGSGDARTRASEWKRTWSRNSQSSAKNGADSDAACVRHAATAAAIRPRPKPGRFTGAADSVARAPRRRAEQRAHDAARALRRRAADDHAAEW